MQWPFIRSQRGLPFLSHFGYVYRNERILGRKTYWLCIKYKNSKCNARIILDGNQIKKITMHNHSIDTRTSNTNKLEYKNLHDNDVEAWLKTAKSK
jgi:hypothetical protein